LSNPNQNQNQLQLPLRPAPNASLVAADQKEFTDMTASTAHVMASIVNVEEDLLVEVDLAAAAEDHLVEKKFAAE